MFGDRENFNKKEKKKDFLRKRSLHYMKLSKLKTDALHENILTTVQNLQFHLFFL